MDNSNYSIIDESLIPFLDEMLLEMSENKLVVTSAPHPDPDKSDRIIRVLTSTNPVWYQELCSLYPDSRPEGANKKKPRTIIKRKSIIRILKALMKNKKSISKYAEFLIDIAKSRQEMCEPVLESWGNQF
jgi:hypothetical protein